MRAGFIQTSPVFGEVESNIEKAMQQIKKVDADLIVLPELFNTGYQFVKKEEVHNFAEDIPGGDTTQRLISTAHSENVYIVAGIAEKYKWKLYNSAVFVGPKGYIGTYRKSHLFCQENNFFDKGNSGYLVFDIGFVKIGIIICFDWRFPEPTRILTLKGADIICHPSNLVLPHAPDAMITRCLENHVFAITADRVGEDQREGKILKFQGRSQVVSPNGEVLYRGSEKNEEEWITEIDPEEARNKKINSQNDLLKDRRVDLMQEML
ncbi:MAG: nitrilase-related carbon-nitrogen hydrolase [Candidatus Pacebacteria bacterium]|nr:nitrilase-related carbon-nitrogen hydrolase [Candidatus Paceibacterota bacterium]